MEDFPSEIAQTSNDHTSNTELFGNLRNSSAFHFYRLRLKFFEELLAGFFTIEKSISREDPAKVGIRMSLLDLDLQFLVQSEGWIFLWKSYWQSTSSMCNQLLVNDGPVV